MEIKDLKDFYIDLNGDIKATMDNTNSSVFLTETNKSNSEYFIADNIDQIKNAIKKINPNFILDFDVYKQYSVKYDRNSDVTGIKIWSDNNDIVDDLKMVLTGYDITEDNVLRDFYFVAPINIINNFIKKNKLVYEVKEFDTHKHFLYSVKYDEDNTIKNFKSYYIKNDLAIYYTTDMIPQLKKTLSFSN